MKGNDGQGPALFFPASNKELQRLGSQADIGVQKGQQLAAGLQVAVPDGPRLSRPVFRRLRDADDASSEVFGDFRRPVGGAVVGDDDFHRFVSLLLQGREQVRKVFLLVSRRDDDGYKRLLFRFAFGDRQRIFSEKHQSRRTAGKKKENEQQFHHIFLNFRL